MQFDEPLDAEAEEIPLLQAGCILGDRYRITDVRGRTRHNVLYEVRDNTTERSFVIKRPRSKTRIEKLRKEGVRASAARGQTIEGVVSVFDTGEHEGIPYVVMEEIKGEDIRRLKEKKLFRPEEVVKIYEKLIKTIGGYSNGSLEHRDIKDGNVMLCDATGEALIVDWGERQSKPRYATDTQAAAALALSLVQDYKKKTGKSVPRELEGMLTKTLLNDHSTPDETLNHIRNYLQLPRKRWKRATYGATAFLAAGLSLWCAAETGLLERVRREFFPTTLESLIDQARANPSGRVSDEQMDKIRIELAKTKIKKDIERIPAGKFPFSTVEKDWHTPSSGPSYSNGYWAGMLIEGWRLTGDPDIEKAARQSLDSIVLTEDDKHFNTAVRFTFSHGRMYTLTGESEYKDHESKAAQTLAHLFNESYGFFSLKRDIPRIDAATIGDVVPAFWSAYEHESNLAQREIYRERAIAQTLAVLTYNKMPDGSIAQAARINTDSREAIAHENPDGMRPDSTVALTQAFTLLGTMTTYEQLKKEGRPDEEQMTEGLLEEATNIADRIILSLPSDSLSRNEYQQPIYINSTSSVIEVKGLRKLARATGDPKYHSAYERIQHGLVTKCISTDLTQAGILMHGCLSAKQDKDTDACLITGDYHLMIKE